MKAFLVYPQQDLLGEFYWFEKIENDKFLTILELLKKLNYLIVDLKSNRFSFSYKKIDSFNAENCFDSFSNCFDCWQIEVVEKGDIQDRIKEYEDDEYDEGYLYNIKREFSKYSLSDKVLVIMPIRGISTYTKIKMNDFCIYPANEVDFYDLNINPLPDPDSKKSREKQSLRAFQTASTKVGLDVFDGFCVIGFPYNLNYFEYSNGDHKFDISLIRELTSYAENALNIIRYNYCHYSKPQDLLTKAGYWYGSFSTVMIYSFKNKNANIHAGHVLNFVPTDLIGIDLRNPETLENHPLTRKDINEVGHIANHALSLNTIILESDSNTTKFVQIMSLFEFLGLPYGWKSFQDIKGMISCHIATNKTEYMNTLSNRFKELTGGENHNGLRTRIVHCGDKIENLLKTEKEIIDLLNELENYIRPVINSMIERYNLTWQEFEQYRVDLKNKLGVK